MSWKNTFLNAVPTAPYHVEVAGIIWCADCRDILPHFPKVDLVLSDPPYLEGDFSWLFLDNMDRNTRIVVTPGKINSFYWIRKRAPQWEYIWKNSSTSLGGAYCLHIGFEPILAYCAPYKPLGNDVLSYPIQRQEAGKRHPWPKPLPLIKKLLSHFSNEKNIILDPFLGSGTTAVAAKELGRKFIGIEISEEYCKIAVKRLKQGVLNFE